MGSSTFNQIKTQFKQKDILTRLIIINIVVFLIITCVSLITKLLKLTDFDLLEYIAVSSNADTLMRRPWTIFSYMFVHAEFFHIFFNMLILYVFGKIFLTNFNPRNLGSLYILGGIAGAAIYFVAFNTIPYYIDMGYPPMIGASASVMAIIFGASFYQPNRQIVLLFLGKIKIIYIALFIFILDFVSLGSSSNPGGHVAHIGGAIVGYIYAKQYLKGKDITRWMTKIMDRIFNLFKKKPAKPKMKVNYQKRDSDYNYNQRKKEKTEEIDLILDKIKSSGYSSLSKDEKKRLFDASQK